MANAGCINAYDCNGCLIQTLQNLDSACIGVGVQYTAPNPLDDKRLDYIKYTDKCGCVQCLSGENEILIYATDGVIKDLTLTNDDVNEAIKIQWNDIFGSNRAKTIVRYKTGSYPVSITDGTLAVEETTKNQYSSTPFSLSGVLDETTYYFTAFALDVNDTIIDVQSGSITTDFFKKLEYDFTQTDGGWTLPTGVIRDSNGLHQTSSASQDSWVVAPIEIFKKTPKKITIVYYKGNFGLGTGIRGSSSGYNYFLPRNNSYYDYLGVGYGNGNSDNLSLGANPTGNITWEIEVDSSITNWKTTHKITNANTVQESHGALKQIWLDQYLQLRLVRWNSGNYIYIRSIKFEY